eukprot:Skav208156  [mRNA]  locus=scaffold2891:74160:74399:+ [translate_table: standard]
MVVCKGPKPPKPPRSPSRPLKDLNLEQQRFPHLEKKEVKPWLGTVLVEKRFLVGVSLLLSILELRLRALNAAFQGWLAY